jgi:Xaa-Pro aminopeptidase
MLIPGEDGLCGGNFRYLADFRPVKGRTLLLLPVEGEPVMWVEHPIFEVAARKLSFVPDSRYVVEAGAASVEELQSRGLAAERVAIEQLDLVPASWYIDWRRHLPSMTLEDASAELAQLRRVKSAEERELCRRCCEIADEAYEGVLAKLHDGMSMYEIDAELEYEVRRRGCERMFNVYASESLSELPWGASARTLKRGGAAFLEISPQLEGYWTQLVRVVSVGEPSAALREMHEVTRAAMDTALPQLTPGAIVGEVLAEMERIIEEAGFTVMATDTGHDLGCTLGETVTWLTRASAFAAEAGQVFEIHPVVMHPDGGCLLIGDTYEITDGGVERMNRSSRDLAIV